MLPEGLQPSSSLILSSQFASGNNITKLLPSSSTVVVKSVPLIPITAVGVSITMFSFGTSPNPPVANLAVPATKFIAILLLLGSGS